MRQANVRHTIKKHTHKREQYAAHNTAIVITFTKLSCIVFKISEISNYYSGDNKLFPRAVQETESH